MADLKKQTLLAPIPDKRYFTIGEVSKLCVVKPHVLRYWEQEFKQLRPSKRRGNRRYYQYPDVVLVREIRELLYSQGYTISGARAYLSSNQGDTGKISHTDSQQLLSEMINEVEKILSQLELSQNDNYAIIELAESDVVE